MSQDRKKQSLRIGICGLGTVGGGTFNLLNDKKAEITRRVGMNLDIVHVPPGILRRTWQRVAYASVLMCLMSPTILKLIFWLS